MAFYPPKNKDSKFDYKCMFKPAIERGIQPSEYWKMAIDDLYELFEIEFKSISDASLMVNEQRERNGMNPKDLRNKLNGN